jgi:ACS family pantothenate transporter-like MFS transporter
MSRVGRVPEGKPYTAKVILGYFTNWRTVRFTLIFSKLPSPLDMIFVNFHSNATLWKSARNFIRFWLKAHNKTGKPLDCTVAQINEYPTLSKAFTAVYSLLAIWISDGPLRGSRWPTIIGNLVAIVIFVLLVVIPVFGPFAHRAPLYILSSIGGSAVPLTMAWMAELISNSAEQRAFTAAAMNTL